MKSENRSNERLNEICSEDDEKESQKYGELIKTHFPPPKPSPDLDEKIKEIYRSSFDDLEAKRKEVEGKKKDNEEKSSS